MTNKNILVLGSKPGSMLPDISVNKIYTSNGSAERAVEFRKKYLNNELISLVGAREFSGNEDVSKRIINSNPQKILVRAGTIILPVELKKKTNLINLTNEEQLNFQSKFFKNKKISVFLGEMKYKKKFFDQIKHILKRIKNNNVLGISTGFYAILLAVEENPGAKIIISGIGMKGGKHFYHSERANKFPYDPRARVDRFMMSQLSKKYKNRLCTLDSDFSEISGINQWDGNSF
jgi:hypothetical protein